MIIRGKPRKPVTNAPGDRLSASPVTAHDIGMRGYLSPRERAAMERSLQRYTELECGHCITRETAILYSVFAQYIKDIYCENCDKFCRVKLRPKAEYPLNPLF